MIFPKPPRFPPLGADKYECCFGEGDREIVFLRPMQPLLAGSNEDEIASLDHFGIEIGEVRGKAPHSLKNRVDLKREAASKLLL